MSSEFIYYVYAYLRKDNTPYYIGKGCKERAFADHITHKPPKDKSRIVFLETNLSDIGAIALERRYIKWYGRKDNNTGILRNKTDGGDGTAGYKFTQQQKENKKTFYQENYGVDHNSQTPGFGDRCKRTSISKYGVNHPSQRECHSIKVTSSNNARSNRPAVLLAKELAKKANIPLPKGLNFRKDEFLTEFIDFCKKSGCS